MQITLSATVAGINCLLCMDFRKAPDKPIATSHIKYPISADCFFFLHSSSGAFVFEGERFRHQGFNSIQEITDTTTFIYLERWLPTFFAALYPVYMQLEVSHSIEVNVLPHSYTKSNDAG